MDKVKAHSVSSFSGHWDLDPEVYVPMDPPWPEAATALARWGPGLQLAAHIMIKPWERTDEEKDQVTGRTRARQEEL